MLVEENRVKYYSIDSNYVFASYDTYVQIFRPQLYGHLQCLVLDKMLPQSSILDDQTVLFKLYWVGFSKYCRRFIRAVKWATKVSKKIIVVDVKHRSLRNSILLKHFS